MNDTLLPPEIEAALTMDNLIRVLLAVGVLLTGYLALKLVVFFVGKSIERRFSAQSSMVVKKTVLYTGMALLFLIIVAQFGVRMSALLGAAGVLGIGLGFAAQTSVSNVISGVFLISEKSLTVGDLITVGETTGIIISIDLLSLKLRTLDNQFVRVPNEDLIRSRVTNITRFPIRRMDILFTVSHSADLARVRTICEEVVASVPESLDEPEPLFLLQGVTPVGCEIRFGVWFPRDQFLEVRNAAISSLLARLNAEDVELARYPFVSDPQLPTGPAAGGSSGAPPVA
ncbi:MAG: mechanosensitive ion channel family protein [Spirochaetales bacterium]